MKYDVNYLYFADIGGTVSIQSTESDQIIHYQLDPHLMNGIIIEILPIHRSNAMAMLLFFGEFDKYAVIMLHVWPHVVTRVFLRHFDC